MKRISGSSMLTRRALLSSATAALALSLAAPAIAHSDGPTPVVATFSILGDMVERIGGESTSRSTRSSAPTGMRMSTSRPLPMRAPSAKRRSLSSTGCSSKAGWTAWSDASDFHGVRVVATDGIEPIAFDDEHEGHDEHEKHAEAGHDHDHEGHDEHEMHAEAGHDDHHHGAFDPHAWQSLANAVVYVDNITAALARTDPANATDFYQNRAAYVAEIEALDAEIREIVASLPAERRTVVTSHDAFQYFGRHYGLAFVAPQGAQHRVGGVRKGCRPPHRADP